MLLGLHIKNVALIEEAEIEFSEGLNILTGETGAGKSMIIDSINFVLGGRVTKDFVRKGAEKAVVQAEFSITDKGIFEVLENLGIETSDEIIVINRTMTSEGKSSARINGVVVTISMLKQVSETLIDIHGQHEHQSLLNPKKHLQILDKFCGEDLDKFKEKLSICIEQYKEVLAKLKEVSGNDKEREERIDLLKYKINEIESASLKIDEEENLEERKEYLNNIEKISRISQKCAMLLYSGTEEQNSALDNVNEAVRQLEELLSIDEKMEDVYESLLNISALLEETGRFIRQYSDSLETDIDEIDMLEERLDLIYRLKKKYGQTIKDILLVQEKSQTELEFIENSEEQRGKLTEEKNSIYNQIKSICDIMSNIRITKAAEISKEIELQLKDLEMKNAYFDIKVIQKETFNSKGRDAVEFMISANLGEEPKPLAKIASGGEMSRIMLAMKTVVADADVIETFIFDEIDAGISGNTASRVGEKLSIIAGKRQIICITHLPQIAAMADFHFLIEKTTEKTRTITKVIRLQEEGQIEEISRLMGGFSGGSLVTRAAEEMKKAANTFKNTKRYK